MRKKVFVEIRDGHKTPLIIRKNKTKKAVIFSHGFGSSKNDFLFRFLEPLLNSSGFSTICFDYPFAGENTLGKTRVGFQDYVLTLERVYGFVKKEGFTDIYLLGHSLGGLTALYLQDKKKFKKLILSSLAINANELPSRFLPKIKLNQIKNKGVVEIILNGKTQIVSREFVRSFEELRPAELTTKIKTPVVLIHGSRDNMVPLKKVEDFYNKIPFEKKKLRVLNCSHNFVSSECFASLIAVIQEEIT